MVESKGEEYGIKSIPVNKATYVGPGIMQILRKKMLEAIHISGEVVI